MPSSPRGAEGLRPEKPQHPAWYGAAQGLESKAKHKRNRVYKRKSRGKGVRGEGC